MKTSRHERHLNCVAVAGIMLLLLTGLPAWGQEPEVDNPRGSVFGSGTQFAVDFDGGTGFSLTAADSIDVAIHAFSAQSLEIALNGVTGVGSTQISISGLPAGISLYKSEDDLRNCTVITVSDSGTYTWLQDLISPHSILIKPEPSTWHLGDSGWVPRIGATTDVLDGWDPVTRTATLTEDIHETIQISGDGITLDGGGYKVDAGGYGIFVVGGSGVTIQNVEVSGSTYGVYLNGGSGHTLQNSKIFGGEIAVYSYNADQLQIVNNTYIGTPPGETLGHGVLLKDCNEPIVQGNTIHAGDWAPYQYLAGVDIHLMHVTGGAFTGNHMSGRDGFRLEWGHVTTNCVIRDNEVLVHNLPIYIGSKAEANEIVNNTFRSETSLALFVRGPTYTNTVYNNAFISSGSLTPYADNSPQSLVLNMPAPVGGNYWSNWTGPDADEDGFVDAPYVISAGQVDDLPYTTPGGWLLNTVAGTVFSDCGVAMAGVTVGLEIGADYISTPTSETGAFRFEDVPRGADVELTCVVPLGFHAVTPPDGHASLSVTEDMAVDFALGCVAATGSARGMGYWKHQATVYTKGKGQAQEAEADMTTNFPAAIFNHFHQNTLNSIAVEGVTYMGDQVALDLATIQATLTVGGGRNMLDRAKQHYLALLLNLASGKILTHTVISEDGRSASEAVQYVARLINDGAGDNDELAKDISEALNEAQVLAAGVIPEDITFIAYRPGQNGVPRSVSLAQNAPNPFNPMTTISFALPTAQNVRLAVYAINGKRIATLVDGVMAQGDHDVIWAGQDDSGRSVASGAYFYRLDAEGFNQTKRMMLLK